MSDLRELYQDLIKDHSKQPRNFRAIEHCSRKLEGFNPLCGDRFTIYVRLDGDRMPMSVSRDGLRHFHGVGLHDDSNPQGKTMAEARGLFHQFHDLLTAERPDSDQESLGKLVVFAGVRKFPVRVKCATLAWHTLKAALEDRHETVSTE